MNLLLDVGNTRLKWGTGCRPDNILSGQPLANNQVTALSLSELWQGLVRPDLVAIASVGSSILLDCIQQVVYTLWPGVGVYIAQAQAQAHGLTNAYQRPEKLGVDRWLGMIAAYHKYQKAFCLVSCGTAITIDVVDAHGKHEGGLIAPGLKLMQKALATGAENLEQIGDGYPEGLADYTEAAIFNGTLFAVCGMIERVLRNQPVGMQLILTGGDTITIADNLKRQKTLEPDLVLHGLALSLPEH